MSLGSMDAKKKLRIYNRFILQSPSSDSTPDASQKGCCSPRADFGIRRKVQDEGECCWGRQGHAGGLWVRWHRWRGEEGRRGPAGKRGPQSFPEEVEGCTVGRHHHIDMLFGSIQKSAPQGTYKQGKQHRNITASPR